MKGWKKIFHTNGDQKKAGVAILISDKIDFKHNNSKPMGHCKSSAKGKIHSITGLPQETRKKSNK